MTPIYAVFFDLDGTLLTRSKDVSIENRNSIRYLAHRGMLLGLATGRDPLKVRELLPLWGIDGCIRWIVGYNGADVLDLQTGVLSKGPYLSLDDFKKLEEAIRYLPVAACLRTQKTLYCSRLTPVVAAYGLMRWQKPQTGSLEEFAGRQFPKFYLFGYPHQIGQARDIQVPNMRLVPVGKYSVECIRAEVSKISGIHKALEGTGIPLENVLTFGDDWNDLDVLSSTYGVAMKNAVEECKKAARQITKYPNMQDGVAYHIRQIQATGQIRFCPWDLKEKAPVEDEENLLMD